MYYQHSLTCTYHFSHESLKLLSLLPVSKDAFQQVPNKNTQIHGNKIYKSSILEQNSFNNANTKQDQVPCENKNIILTNKRQQY